MSNCLITKLNGVSDNSDLIKVGEIQVKIHKNPDENSFGGIMSLMFSKDSTIEVIGDGYMDEDSTFSNKRTKLDFTSNVQKDVYFSNGEYTISIKDKYSLTLIYIFGRSYNTPNDYVSFSIDSLTWSNDICNLACEGKQVTGDLYSLRYLTKLQSVDLLNTQVYGDIDKLMDGKDALKTVKIISSKVYGDIGSFSGHTNMETIAISAAGVSGDIASLKNLTKLIFLDLRQTGTTGDISNISSMSELFTCALHKPYGNILAVNSTKIGGLYCNGSTDLNGDLALLRKDFKFLDIPDDYTSTFSWSSRATDAYITAITGQSIMTTSLDTVLINMAKCLNGITSGSAQLEKIISFVGTRTSASDSAIETLTEYGYSILITKA